MSGPEEERQQEQEQEQEQEQSLARVEQGGIPLSAERRLKGLSTLKGTPHGGAHPEGHGQAGERGGSFTSDLSVNGFALCHQLGLKPLSQVMGSSIYQMGYQGAWGAQGYGGGGILIELDTLTQALNEVRSRALVRLAEEAHCVGADAVVGVQTRAGESQLDTGTFALEHVAVGTAVSRKGANAKQPVLSELSVAEYAMLLQGGFEPLGIVAWSAVFFTSYVYGGMAGGGMLAGGGPLTMGVQSFELREFTQAIYSAREAVMQQITGQASALGAAGVVGVKINHSAQPHTLTGGMGMGGGVVGGRELRGLMVTFTAVGTAIQQHGDHTIPAPKPTIDLFT